MRLKFIEQSFMQTQLQNCNKFEEKSQMVVYINNTKTKFILNLFIFLFDKIEIIDKFC